MPLILSAVSSACSLAASICARLRLLYHLNAILGIYEGILPLVSKDVDL